jgi:hypothetical protein
MTVCSSRSRGRRSSIFVLIVAGCNRGASGAAGRLRSRESATVEGKGIDRW